jgi:hypothetical protein
MSRTTLGPEAGAVIQECLENLDKTFRVSRTSLERALIRKLADLRGNASGEAATRGQAGP